MLELSSVLLVSLFPRFVLSRRSRPRMIDALLTWRGMEGKKGRSGVSSVSWMGENCRGC